MCPRRRGPDRDLCLGLWVIVALFAAWFLAALYMMSWYAGSLS